MRASNEDSEDSYNSEEDLDPITLQSRQAKQELLFTQVIDQNYDPDLFMEFALVGKPLDFSIDDFEYDNLVNLIQKFKELPSEIRDTKGAVDLYLIAHNLTDIDSLVSMGEERAQDFINQVESSLAVVPNTVTNTKEETKEQSVEKIQDTSDKNLNNVTTPLEREFDSLELKPN